MLEFFPDQKAYHRNRAKRFGTQILMQLKIQVGCWFCRDSMDSWNVRVLPNMFQVFPGWWVVNFLLGGAEIAESQSLENLSADGDDLIPKKSF